MSPNNEPSKHRITVVDDSEFLLELAREALEGAGYEVHTVSDLNLLEEQTVPPHLILMDVQMPELYGDDVAVILRQARGVDSKIYLFSSLDPEELARRSSDAELDGYISKREGMEHMVGEVKKILADTPASDAGAAQ